MAKQALRILQIHTFYDEYLQHFYRAKPELSGQSYAAQIGALLEDGFSGAHMFAPYLKDLGYEPLLVIANCAQAQAQWVNENGVKLNLTPNWIYEISAAQVDHFKPDILYLSHPIGFDTRFVRSLKHKPRLIVGWRAASVAPGTDWSAFDCMLSHLAASRELSLKLGAKKAEHFFPGFPTNIAKAVEAQPKQFDVVFSGQWSREHAKRNQYLLQLAEKVASGEKSYRLGYFLSVSPDCPVPPVVAKVNHGARWGLEMYKALRSGKIVLNAEIDLAKGDAGNMRLFETTGTGSFLLTEHHSNIQQYYKPGVELETFQDSEELSKKIDYFLANDAARERIALAGQSRALGEYSVERRAAVLDQIFRRLLDSKEGSVKGQTMNTSTVSGVGAVHQGIEAAITELVKLINHDNLDQALTQLNSISSQYPERHELRYGKAVVLARQGKNTEAVGELQGLLGIVPQHQSAKLLLSELQQPLASVAEPVESVGDPKTAEVNQLMDQALVALDQKDISRAMDLVIQAKGLKVPVRDLDHVRALCFIAKEGENYLGEARQSLLEELRHFPDNSAAKTLLDQVVAEHQKIGADRFRTGDPDFDQLLPIIRPYSMLPDVRLYTLFTLAKQVCQSDVPGNFAECGVAGGGSTALLAAVIKRFSRRPRKVYAFDSYEGMPVPSAHDTVKGKDAESTGWGTGTCAAPEDSVKEISAKLGVSELVQPVKGYFDKTLPITKPQMGQLALLHADCDWYESAKTILENLYDPIVPGGLFQIDDYGYWDGMKKAMDEFCAARGIRPEIRNIDGGSAWMAKS